MKLKNTTYNEKYPSFDIRAMNARQEGVPLNESVTIQLVSDVFEWQGTALSGPLLQKEIKNEEAKQPHSVYVCIQCYRQQFDLHSKKKNFWSIW